MHNKRAYSKIRFGFIAAALCIGFFVVITYLNMHRSETEGSNVTKSLQNLMHLENIITDIQSIETGQRGYVISGEEIYLDSYNAGLESIQGNLNFLQDQLKSDTANKSKRQQLLRLIGDKINISRNTINIRKNAGFGAAASHLKIGRGEQLMVQIRAAVLELEETDRKLLKEANIQNELAAKRTVREFLILALFFYVVLYVSYRALIKDLKRKALSDEKMKFNTTIVNNISDAIITLNEKFEIASWNKFAEEIYGWKAEEVTGKSMKDTVKTMYDGTEYSFDLDEFKNAGRWSGELLHEHKNGKPVYVHTSASLIKDEEGKISGAIAITRDITERKGIEAKLKLFSDSLEIQVNEKVAELNSVFERITDAVIALDNNWNYTYLNEKAAALHKREIKDLIGKNIWDLNPDVVNEDFYTALHKARTNMQPVRLELFYSKTKQWFEDHIYPSSQGISVYYRDVTERKNTQIDLEEAESKFRSLVEQSSVGVYILQEGKFIYTNPCFGEIFGYTPEQLLNEVNVLDLVSEKDKAKVLENIGLRIREDWSSLNYEFEGVKSNGELVNVEVYGNILNYKGKLSVIGTLINVHERKIALKKLEDSEEALLKSNERFMLVAKATNDLIWDWNMETDTIRGNESFSNLYGRRSGDPVMFEEFRARIHPSDVKQIILNLENAIINKETFLIEEFRFKITDETYRTLYDKSYILYNKEGSAIRMLGAMQDITDQKLAQQQLILEKELSDSIINSLPGIFYLFNQEGKFYRWNRNFEIVTGYSTDEIAHLHPIELFPEEETELLKGKIANVFKNGEDNVEAHFLTKAKDEIPYYFTGMLINYEGEVCLMGVGIDLSEKVKSQQKLIESEEKFRMLIEQASDGIFISNQMGEYLVVNSSAAALTGYTRSELLKMNMRDLIFEEDMSPGPFKIKELIGGQVVIDERFMKQKDGNIINIEISSKLLPDGRFQGIVRDITTRKSVEEALRYSEEKTRLIMDSSLDAIITLDTRGLITFWNKQAEVIFGWNTEEVLGKKLSGIIVPEQFRERHDKGLENYVRTNTGFRVNNILELSALNRKGSEFPIELTVIPIRQNTELFFCAFIRDISSRKKTEEEIRLSEHKYRLLFEQNPMPMWMISLPGKNFLAVNTAAAEYYGYTREEFLQMNIRHLRPEEERGGGSVISTYKSGISNTGIWEHIKKDGTIVKVSLVTHDIIFEGKHAKLVLAIDMTEKIRAEEKLKSSHGELRQLATHLQNIRETERTHMAREIHDELGQQLTGLKMDISWINKRLINSDSEIKIKMGETLKLIDGTVKTVRRLATQLRPSILDDLGVIAAMEWQSEEFQKRSEIETIFKSNISSIDLSSDLATGFFRIYQESLTNVLRHAKATKIETILNLKDGLLILSISDNGIGFNSKGIENKKTLGLLGMKERTLIMGGSYEITSKPGKGTTVVIIVPIYQNQKNS